ncbi:MAG: transcriptional regulator [Bacteroidales bacterium]|nr:transcriptional regulator [Bacteroidales bacterium]
MPKNFHAQVRYNAINECLKNKWHQPSSSSNLAFCGYWTLSELKECIDSRLQEIKGHSDISERTIQNDIKEMRYGSLGYAAPIENRPGIGYCYSDPDFSITDNPLTDRDIEFLKEALLILRQFKGFRYFDDLEVLTGKLEQKITRMELPAIVFDANPNTKGLEHIEKIRNSMKQKIPLYLSYLTYNLISVETIFHPYLLKEYNNRWFVYGFSAYYSSEGVYALDRIEKLTLYAGVPFIIGDLQKVSTYFKHILGVTNKEETSIEKIVIKVIKPRSNYIASKPIHETQRVVKENKDYKWFSFRLRINNELISTLLSFGDDLKVCEPENLVNEMGLITKKMDRLYSNHEELSE